jgi:hypothetical protein
MVWFESHMMLAALSLSLVVIVVACSVGFAFFSLLAFLARQI